MAKGNLKKNPTGTNSKRLFGTNAMRNQRTSRADIPGILTDTQKIQGFDWIKYCRQLSSARMAQEKRLREKAGLATNTWDERAGHFRGATQQEMEVSDHFLDFMSKLITPQKTVLDVGAGTGRHALPLAKLAKQVTAVEPAEGMRHFMKVEAVRLQLKNLSIVPKKWEEAEVEPCDIAYCSHVLLHVADVAQFIEKLRDNAKEYCVMVIGTSQQNRRFLELWKLVHREERCPHPDFIELFNVIYQAIGVCPNIEVTPSRLGRVPNSSYGSFDEAVGHIARQLLVAQEASEIKLVQNYLKDRLIVENGRLTLPQGPANADAIFWWDNRPGSPNLFKIDAGLWEGKKKRTQSNLDQTSSTQVPAISNAELLGLRG